ncbi:uncharacterized protein MEPE_02367 [Melanopsichium pennsylvanicum]|uniref:Uncharacterized protein n=1 Tax=Melanopsichium pennsylvanicum TaxID=63383 RepID=A0AAJ4XJG1_9BASI|nr:uncharacterized protein MEPE_02367 [Melanopsichium pennsylvanicum]
MTSFLCQRQSLVPTAAPQCAKTKDVKSLDAPDVAFSYFGAPVTLGPWASVLLKFKLRSLKSYGPWRYVKSNVLVSCFLKPLPDVSIMCDWSPWDEYCVDVTIRNSSGNECEIPEDGIMLTLKYER